MCVNGGVLCLLIPERHLARLSSQACECEQQWSELEHLRSLYKSDVLCGQRWIPVETWVGRLNGEPEPLHIVTWPEHEPTGCPVVCSSPGDVTQPCWDGILYTLSLFCRVILVSHFCSLLLWAGFNLFWLYFCRCLFFPLFAYCTDLHYSFVSTIVNTWMCVTVLGLNMLGLPMIKTWLTQSEPKNRRYLCSIRHFRWSWPVKMFVSECVRVIVCEKKEREIVIVWERETERQREMERERVILCERERERERVQHAAPHTVIYLRPV